MNLLENVFNHFFPGITGLDIKGSDFRFDCFDLLYHKCHKINLKQGELYIDSPDWIKNKK